MTSIVTTDPTTSRGVRASKVSVALLGAAVVFAATAVIDLVGHPAGGSKHLATSADYVFTAALIPIALSVLTALRRAQEGRDGRVGTVGFRFAAVGLTAFVLDGAVTLITANPDSAGPLYPLAMLASIVGFVCIAVGANRAGGLPRWAMPALTAAWIFGGPIAEGSSTPFGFRGACLIFAGVATAVALSGRAPDVSDRARSGPDRAGAKGMPTPPGGAKPEATRRRAR